MDLEDVLAAADVGSVDLDLTVKATGAEQSGVKDVGTVGGGDDHDALVGAEAVHLHEQLVEGLLALVVTAAKARASLATDGVDLVDEDDGRARLAGSLKQVADAGRAHADVHLHEIRARDGEEGNACLSCDGLGQEGLTRTGRAHQEDAVGNARAEGGVLGGSLEVIHDLHKLLFFLIGTRDVAEGDAVLVVGQLDVGLAEASHLTAGACVHHALHSEVVKQDESDHHDHAGQERYPPGEGVGGAVFEIVENGDARAVLHLDVHDGHDLAAGAGDVGQLIGLLGAQLELDALGQGIIGHACLVHGEGENVAVLGQIVAVVVLGEQTEGQVALVVVELIGRDLSLVEILQDLTVGQRLGARARALVDPRDDSHHGEDGKSVAKYDFETALHWIPPF